MAGGLDLCEQGGLYGCRKNDGGIVRHVYRVLGLEAYVVIRLDWVLVWIIVCVFNGVYSRKGESVREKFEDFVIIKKIVSGQVSKLKEKKQKLQFHIHTYYAFIHHGS